MNERDLIKKVKLVLAGYEGHSWMAVEKKGRSWEIVATGLGIPLRENFDDATLLFRHDRNDCTLAEAAEKLQEELIVAEWRVEKRKEASEGKSI